MSFSSKKWADIICTAASRVFFIIIIAQVPIFRFPCRMGTCQSPLDVLITQLNVSEIFPQVIVKALLYPKAIKRSLMEGTTIPSSVQIVHSYRLRMRNATVITDLKHLEVIAGSYLCVAGAFLGLIKSGRMSVLGSSLILWGIMKEMFLGKYDYGESLCIYPGMIITIVIAFFSMRRDVRKLIKCCKH